MIYKGAYMNVVMILEKYRRVVYLVLSLTFVCASTAHKLRRKSE